MQFIGPTAPEAGAWTRHASDMTAVIGAMLVADEVPECAGMLARDYPQDALLLTAAADLLPPRDWVVTIDCPVRVPYDRVGWLMRQLIRLLGVEIRHDGRQLNPEGITKPQIWGAEPVPDAEANREAWFDGEFDFRDGLTAEERRAEEIEMHNYHFYFFLDDVFPPDQVGFGSPAPPPIFEREAIYEPVWHRAVWLLQARMLVDAGSTWEGAAVTLALHPGTYPRDGFHVTQPGYWDLPESAPTDPRLNL